MAEDDVADRASQEIKALIRKLDPNSSSHKDRIRRLNKFRNFVTGEGVSSEQEEEEEDGGGDKDSASHYFTDIAVLFVFACGMQKGETPEFYDDDIPLLLLGSAAPTALLGEDADNFNDTVYGLLQACGTPSVEHDQMLKRSARHAMNLLKFLVCDFVEDGGHTGQNNLNLFARAFCSLPVDRYKFMSLDLHVVGDQRGGAKEDASHVMVQLLCHHMAEDGETHSPLAISDLLLTPSAQQAFELWCTQNTTKEQQVTIKDNASKRLEILQAQREEDMENAEFDDEELDSDEEGAEDAYDEDGALAGLRRKRRAAKKEVMEATHAGELEKQRKGPALRWEDSQLYREQRARFAAHQRMQEGGEFHDTVRDSQEAAAEMAEREEEKSKILRKDPLGLKDTDFDLRTVEKTQVEVLEQALMEFQEELRKGEAGGEDDIALRAKKESLESILDGIVGVAGAEAGIRDTGRSILPTEANFDPILFLTLVHRKATYEELVGSMNRLSSKLIVSIPSQFCLWSVGLSLNGWDSFLFFLFFSRSRLSR